MNDSAHILLIGLDSDIAPRVVGPLVAAGYQVHFGTSAGIDDRAWAAVISAPSRSGLDALELLAAIASSAHGRPPLLVVGHREEIAALGEGEPVRTLRRPFEPQDLVEAVRSLQPSAPEGSEVPSGGSATGASTLLTESAFRECLDHEIKARNAGAHREDSFVVSVRLHELAGFSTRLGAATLEAVFRQLEDLARIKSRQGEIHAESGGGTLLMLLNGITSRQARERVMALNDRIAIHPLRFHGQKMTFTPVIGYARVWGQKDADSVLADVGDAAVHAASRLDLQPVFHRRARVRRGPGSPWSWLVRLNGAFRPSHRIWMQFFVTTLLGIWVPFVLYFVLGSLGWDITRGIYLAVVIMLVLTALSIWVEGLLALRPVHPPDNPAMPYPPATAIIAAYLPNEAPIIESTIAAFLRLQYPAPLQVILAYNTPKDMDIEARLQRIAADHPNFIPMRVHGSTSKAQNVNAALPHATGEFTAVFDADHQPDPDSFRRAWRWLSHGADVVQGHCLIRNGDATWVARMIAIEFEQIYAVNHPGRARMHDFGIFGGSNGFWRTTLLRQLRMHGFMLTEDIDSSLRAVIGGRTIVSDPYLVSRELAPDTMAALSRQRLRWAQGWFQITLKWTIPALRSPRLNLQQKLGMLQLLAWREMFPWVSMQVVPLVAYWAVEAGSLWRLDWLVPIFVVTTLVTMTTGPGQILFIYRLADAQVKQHRGWFWFYVWTSVLFYSGLKNSWTRIAHIKEAMGESAWIVTPRTSGTR